MQVLAPMVTEVREKYKDDQKKMNEEMMKLYRTYGVNPAGGCLPLLIQFPFLIAYYKMLAVALDLRHAHWLWVHDLSARDHLWHERGC